MPSARRNGLGRGLGALIPSEGATAARSGSLREVPLGRIRPNQFQPRHHFDEEALSSLVDSIRVVGVLQPVLVRQVADGEYELIAGERRCRAARRAGLQTVPALVQTVDDASSLEQALIENLHREDLNALDEAAAYKQLIEDFELTHEEIARRVGRSRAAVTNSLRLIQLPPSVQRLLRDKAISAGHARALLGTPDRDLQERLAAQTVDEGLSVRALEEAVRTALRDDREDTAWATPPPFEEPHRGGDSGHDLEGAPPAANGAVAGAATGLDVAGIGGGLSTSHRPASDQRPPGVLELEELLADHLSTRVRVELGARHGRVVVEFATLEDLERISRAMVGDRSPTV